MVIKEKKMENSVATIPGFAEVNHPVKAVTVGAPVLPRPRRDGLYALQAFCDCAER
jgi:hypothetical protein